ncbi:MAG: hypothetical protein II566_09985 [Lachnospiraceae bacterium]|nr:hypothetical protein [Lachnospiraceae bacterium]MBQ2577586.1 hypothetical protein [Lachnospiraceae bacterium]
MKLDIDIRRLANGVSVGCAVLCLIEIGVALALSAFGIITLKPASQIIASILASVGGTVVIVGCFWWMASALQQALNKEEDGGEQVKKGVTTGYNKRLMAQGIWIVISIFVPKAIYGDFVSAVTICGLLPLLFPRIAILGLQKAGRINT